MNYADFDTQPNGFPLESDATLGFVQRNLSTAIETLAKVLGPGSWILDGVVVSGGTCTDGYIFHNNEILKFVGGSVSTNFIIDETVVQKANEDSTLVDRYFTREARFGTGAGEVAFSTLKRYKDTQTLTPQNTFTVLSGTPSVSKQGETGNIIAALGSFSAASGTVAFTLPAQFRPSVGQYHPITCATLLGVRTLGEIYVDIDGQCYVYYAGTPIYFFITITYIIR